jgi:glycosyltransferase involved in cell wall biosynthesis
VVGSAKTPLASVVICTYNRRDLLSKCLVSLFDQTCRKDDYEIVVVHDGSTDGTDAILQQMAAKPGPPLRHFRQDNKGSATARNVGISQARGEVIASIDDDCVAAERWMESAVPHFADENIVGAQGRTLPAKPARLHFSPPLFSHTIEVTRGVPNHPTCNVFCGKQAIEDVGGFNEKFKMTGAEDLELALRIEQKGRVVFDPDVLVHHAVF